MYLFSSSVGGFLFCGATSCSASSATAIANHRGNSIDQKQHETLSVPVA